MRFCRNSHIRRASASCAQRRKRNAARSSRRRAPVRPKFRRRPRSAADLKDLKVDKMRRMEGLAALKQTLFDGWRGWRAEQDFEDGGSVDDDHRVLRSSRRTRAGLRVGETDSARRAGRAVRRPSGVRRSPQSQRGDSRITTCPRAPREPSGGDEARRGRFGSGPFSTAKKMVTCAPHVNGRLWCGNMRPGERDPSGFRSARRAEGARSPHPPLDSSSTR